MKGDGGESAAACRQMFPFHPPGSPVYNHLLKLCDFLPFGAPGYRSALLSAVSAGLCVTVVLAITGLLYRRLSVLAATGATLSLFLSFTFFNQAIRPEAYAVNSALFTIVIYLLLNSYSGSAHNAGKFLPAASLLTGLALQTHYLSLFLVPILFHGIWNKAGRRKVTFSGLNLLFFISGCSIRFSDILLSRRMADPGQWNLQSIEDFLRYVSGSGFSREFIALDLERIIYWAAHTCISLPFFAVVTAATGMWSAFRKKMPGRWILLWMIAWSITVTLFYGIEDIHEYIIPGVIGFVLFIPQGMLSFGEKFKIFGFRNAVTVAAAAVVLSSVTGFFMMSGPPEFLTDYRNYYAPEKNALHALRSINQDKEIWTDWAEGMPFFYCKRVLRSSEYFRTELRFMKKEELENISMPLRRNFSAPLVLTRRNSGLIRQAGIQALGEFYVFDPFHTYDKVEHENLVWRRDIPEELMEFIGRWSLNELEAYPGDFIELHIDWLPGSVDAIEEKTPAILLSKNDRIFLRRRFDPAFAGIGKGGVESYVVRAPYRMPEGIYKVIFELYDRSEPIKRHISACLTRIKIKSALTAD